ncbi:MAG: TMEM175 family protein [Acidobacteriota bacterium]|nr:TMEM175 family protein [Acidobacteriota bacterium]
MALESVSPARLEAFSDGVIAVIITIMVLELKAPPVDGWVGFRMAAPALLLYLLTFTQVGIYWVNHHYLTDEIQSVSHGMLWANLIFLFNLSLFPFGTAWVAARGLSSFAAALYAVISLLPGLSYTVLSLLIHVGSGPTPPWTRLRQVLSNVLYFSAIPVAYYKPLFSMVLIGTVALLWTLPPEKSLAQRGRQAGTSTLPAEDR